MVRLRFLLNTYLNHYIYLLNLITNSKTSNSPLKKNVLFEGHKDILCNRHKMQNLQQNSAQFWL